MRGKDKCRMLREIRRRIAQDNDIAYITKECTYQGECRGTCPKCESELAYLERELAKKQSLGKRVALGGVALGTLVALAGCTPRDAADALRSLSNAPATKQPTVEVLEGEVAAPDPEPTPEPLIDELEGDVAVLDPEPTPDNMIEELEGEATCDVETTETFDPDDIDVMGIVPNEAADDV